MLSQLSYTPRYYRGLLLILALFFFSEELVGSSGLEPPTSRLSGARSNLLSYEPAARCRLRTRTFFGLVGELSRGPLLWAVLGFHQYWLLWILACALFPSLLVLVRSRRSVFRFTCVMEMMGFEPMTPCLQGRCSPN